MQGPKISIPKRVKLFIISLFSHRKFYICVPRKIRKKAMPLSKEVAQSLNMLIEFAV